MKKYKIYYFDYYVLLFFCISFAGWVWEVMLCLIQNHTFANRGVYYGPYLPVYGLGGVFIMFLFGSLRRAPFKVFFLSAFICTLLEYAAASWLEYRWGTKWWDYSEYLLNFNGRICLLCSIGFGLAGVFLISVFQPVFNKFYHKMTICCRICISLILLAVFLADAAYSISNPNMGKNITCTFMSIILI